MGEDYEYAEYRATIPGDLGYECTFYYGLRWRTAHLLEHLYVVVEVEGLDFRPRPGEHFPAIEHFAYQGVWEGLGAGAPVEALFRLYAPARSGGVEEGVRAINAGLEELAARVSLGHWSRSMAAALDNRRYTSIAASSTPYRPPAGALRDREASPKREPFTATVLEQATELFRGELSRRGVLEDYDRLRADLRKTPQLPRAPDRPTTQWPEYDERYERMGGQFWLTRWRAARP